MIMVVTTKLMLKLKLWWSNKFDKQLKKEHEPGYAIVIKIHVLPSGEARVTYDGNITLAPKVMGEVTKMLEAELEQKQEMIIKYDKKFTVIGKREGGVLSKATIKEESSNGRNKRFA